VFLSHKGKKHAIPPLISYNKVIGLKPAVPTLRLNVAISTRIWYIKENLKLFWSTRILSDRMCSTYAQLSIPTVFTCWSIKAIISLAGCTDFDFSFFCMRC
jgi:hypothetical protein